MPTALLREVASTFDRAIVSDAGRRPDVDLAREQHHRYAQALIGAGYDVEVIAADHAHPDCVFIEDTAVIIGSTAVIARPGASERRGEGGPVVTMLETRFPIARIEAPGTLDGGDVMVLGRTVFVGRSKRTNDSGVAQLAEVSRSEALTFTAVPVHEVLHLKSAVLPVADATIVVTPGTVDESLLSDLQILHEAKHERHRFSALRLASGEALVTANAPDTAHMVADLGIAVTPLDISEVQAADGGLTCMSILIED
ncbi:MAG TPA: arginine deiminase family protein [Acidimicrobiia bacterium]